jgi:hypothetical protein
LHNVFGVGGAEHQAGEREGLRPMAINQRTKGPFIPAEDAVSTSNSGEIFRQIYKPV